MPPPTRPTDRRPEGVVPPAVIKGERCCIPSEPLEARSQRLYGVSLASAARLNGQTLRELSKLDHSHGLKTLLHFVVFPSSLTDLGDSSHPVVVHSLRPQNEGDVATRFI